MKETLLQKSIRDIEPGDFLAEDIRDAKGKVILEKGTELDATHMNLLMSNRVFTVRVGSEAQVKGGGIIASGGRPALERMFAPHMDDPIMLALYKAAVAILET